MRHESPGRNPSLQSNEIEQELEPEVKHPTPSVTDLLSANWFEESGSHVVVNLSSQILFQEFARLFRVKRKNIAIPQSLFFQQGAMRLAHLVRSHS